MTGTVLVTGASRGLGLATAVAFAEAGHQVFATMRDPAKAPEALESRTDVEVLRLDVTDPTTVAAAIDRVRVSTGDVPDVLVNNAAVGVISALEELQPDELRDVLETNVVGVFETCRRVVPGMRARGSGRIVNIGSIGGRVATPGLGSYSTSKFALVGLTTTLRRELRQRGIDVVLIEPGAVRTDLIGPGRSFGRAAWRTSSGPYQAIYQRLATLMQSSFETMGMTPEELARRIVRAATCKRPRARYVIGADARALAWFQRMGDGALQDGLLERSFATLMGRASG
ncbi:MAG: SDR family oxidoreductase [Deltaproteobacteria bacterium]|nr:SDR family oxidoreductase [Deltaproteobacteria bacterium]